MSLSAHSWSSTALGVGEVGWFKMSRVVVGVRVSDMENIPV